MELMLKNQRIQIEYLMKDRKLLEDRIKLLHDRLASDGKLYEAEISQMQRDLSVQEMEHVYQEAKTDLFIGMKQKDAFWFKKKFEDADEDLSDLRKFVDCLSNMRPAEHNVSTSANGGELTRLKDENENLRAEKTFVWNQYNELEKDLNKQLKAKKDEVKTLDDKIQILLSRLEEQESSNTVKDAMIATLKSDMEKLESESRKKDEKISNLSKEAEILRHSKNGSRTPLLKRCIKGGSAASLRLSGETAGVRKGRRTVTFKTESSSSAGRSVGQETVRRSLRKRNVVDSVNISKQTSKLFSSSFKLPKLKALSPAPR